MLTYSKANFSCSSDKSAEAAEVARIRLTKGRGCCSLIELATVHQREIARGNTYGFAFCIARALPNSSIDSLSVLRIGLSSVILLPFQALKPLLSML